MHDRAANERPPASKSGQGCGRWYKIRLVKLQHSGPCNGSMKSEFGGGGRGEGELVRPSFAFLSKLDDLKKCT